MGSLWWGIFGCQGARQGAKRCQAVENAKYFHSYIMLSINPSHPSIVKKEKRLGKGVDNVDYSSPRW